MQNIFNNHWQRQQNVDLQKEGKEGTSKKQKTEQIDKKRAETN